nr:hypothetical protein NEMVEDRAFT_v1g7543 [Ipomoea trifida]
MSGLCADTTEKCRNVVRTWPRNAATWCRLCRYMPQRGADLVRTRPRNAATWCGLGRYMPQRCAEVGEKCRNDVRTWARNAATWCGLCRYMPQRDADLVRTRPRNAATMCGLGREMPQRGADLADTCRNEVRRCARNPATMCGLGREIPQRGADLADTCQNEVRTWATNACGLGRYMPQRCAEVGEKCRNDVRTVRGHGREMPRLRADLVRTWARNAATMCGLGSDMGEKCRNEVRTVRGHGREMPQRCADFVRTWPRNAATMCGLGADMAEKCRNERFPGNVVRTWCGLGLEMPQRGAGHGREMSQRWARPWPRSAAISSYRGLLANHPSTFDDDVRHLASLHLYGGESTVTCSAVRHRKPKRRRGREGKPTLCSAIVVVCCAASLLEVNNRRLTAGLHRWRRVGAARTLHTTGDHRCELFPAKLPPLFTRCFRRYHRPSEETARSPLLLLPADHRLPIVRRRTVVQGRCPARVVQGRRCRYLTGKTPTATIGRELPSMPKDRGRSRCRSCYRRCWLPLLASPFFNHGRREGDRGWRFGERVRHLASLHLYGGESTVTCSAVRHRKPKRRRGREGKPTLCSAIVVVCCAASLLEVNNRRLTAGLHRWRRVGAARTLHTTGDHRCELFPAKLPPLFTRCFRRYHRPSEETARSPLLLLPADHRLPIVRRRTVVQGRCPARVVQGRRCRYLTGKTPTATIGRELPSMPKDRGRSRCRSCYRRCWLPLLASPFFNHGRREGDRGWRFGERGW